MARICLRGSALAIAPRLSYFSHMDGSFSRILVIYKTANPEAGILARTVAAWLEEMHFHALGPESAETDYDTSADCAIVLGGDGTILGAARRLAGKNIPVFGINFGRVGFLTTANPGDWMPKLQCALAGQMPVRNCLALTWELRRHEHLLAGGVAANDVVISCGSLARLLSLELKIDDGEMGTLRSDGLIVSTPLGSSGYTISAGGPLLKPDMNAMILTPVCPFVTNISPLVFPQGTLVKLRLTSLRDTWLTIDGQEGHSLRHGDIVRIGGWPDAMQFFGDDAQFFERLRSRGFNLEDCQAR